MKEHFKMYKSGKYWVFGLVIGSTLFGISQVTIVNADQVNISSVSTSSTDTDQYSSQYSSESNLTKGDEKKKENSTDEHEQQGVNKSEEPNKEIPDHGSSDSTEQTTAVSSEAEISTKNNSSVLSSNDAAVSKNVDEKSYMSTNPDVAENIMVSDEEQKDVSKEEKTPENSSANMVDQTSKALVTQKNAIPVSSSNDDTGMARNSGKNSRNLKKAVVSGNTTANEVETSKQNTNPPKNKIYRTNFISQTSTSGFSVSDPDDYPNDMWKDPNNEHYTFGELLSSDKNKQIVFSSDRQGNGILYVNEIDNRTGRIISQQMLNQNDSYTLPDGTIIYNDNYAATVHTGSSSQYSFRYMYGVNDNPQDFNVLSFQVPMLITQSTEYVDEKNQIITDSNGNTISSVTQKGLSGQKYSTSAKSIPGYYLVREPENADGYMSQYGVVGQSYYSDFHDGIKIKFTQIDDKGAMRAEVFDNGRLAMTVKNIPPYETPKEKYYTDDGRYYVLSNPYIAQTRNVKYIYKKVGQLVPDVPGFSPIEYQTDPNDPSRVLDPTVPNIPGYTPVDNERKAILPGTTVPLLNPNDPSVDTPIHYIKNDIQVPSQPVDPNGQVIDHPGIDFPDITISGDKQPGDTITLDPSSWPDVPGYDKPSTPVQVKVPAEGDKVDLPYIVNKLLPNTGSNEKVDITIIGLLIMSISNFLMFRKKWHK